MKILLITHKFYPDVGGIEVNSEILAKEFSKLGHDVRVMTWSRKVKADSFTFSVIREPKIIEMVHQHRWADVVFENNPSLRLSWPRLLIRRPSVVAVRTWIRRIDGSIALADKLKIYWLKMATSVIAVSRAVKDRSYKGAIVIGNPYRSEMFRTLGGISRSDSFAFLGRLVSDKGADMAIRAFGRLIQDLGRRDTTLPTLTIIGDGPDLSKLKNEAASLNISDLVRFTGMMSGNDLVSELNSHKYLIIPSIWEEPFGNVALEGIGSGCIPIASDGGGLPDAVGKAGLIFERGNEKDLVARLKEVFSDTQLQEQLFSNAEKHLQNHSPSFVAKRYLEVIENAYRSYQ